MDWLIISLLILLGIGLIVIEIIFVPGTTVVGFLGFGLGGYGIYLGYDYFGNTTGHIVLGTSVLLTFVSIFYSFKSEAWKKFANKSVIYSKVNEGLTKNLNEGDLGETTSSLRPIGKGIFNDKEYEVTSRGNFIAEKQAIRIFKIENNKIIVETSN